MDNQPTSGQPDTPQAVKPGDTIAPGSVEAQPAPVLPAPQPEPVAAASVTVFDEPEQPGSPPADTTERKPAKGAIAWTAAEFIAHNKSASWYGLLALADLILAAVIFLLTRDKISTSVAIVAGIAFGIYAARKPNQQRYSLDEQGLTVGDKYFPYDLFRSFSVIDEEHVSSISFLPLKRFGQLTTIYYHPEDEDAIVDLLADRLPMDEHGHDVVDRFMKRIKF